MTKPRRWLRWLLIAGVLVLALVAAGVWWAAAEQAAGERELARVRAELDATDPGWRLDDLVAAHNAALPPDDRNSAILIDAVCANAVGFRSQDWTDTVPHRPAWNRRPPPAFDTTAVPLWEKLRPAIADARRLRDRPRGGPRLATPADPFALSKWTEEKFAQAVDVLYLDVIVSAHRGDPDQALASLHAILHATHAVGPLTWDGLSHRLGARSGNVCGGIERVLAWTQPKAGLAELHAALVEELAAPLLADAARVERARMDRLFEMVERGEVTSQQLAKTNPNQQRLSPRERREHLLYPLHRAADHAAVLKETTELVRIARQPAEDWQTSLAATGPGRPGSTRLVTEAVATPAGLLVGAALQDQAELRSAVAAIACERHRQATGQWPDSLAELPKSLLPAVPRDPFDGQPLRYRKLPDGVVVYSVGYDGKDDGGYFGGREIRDERRDVGFRLWDPAHRAVAP